MRGTRPMLWAAIAILALAGCPEKDEEMGEVSDDPAMAVAGKKSAGAAAEADLAGAPDEAMANEEQQEPAEAPPAKAKVGEPAPGFTLTDQAGTEHTLADYRGKIVVLEWTNPECPYVQRHYEAGTMTGLVESFPDDRVQWLAIDSSHFVEPADSQKWRNKHDIPYPILQDPEGEVGRAYEARTTPHMFVIDAEGVLRYAGGIDDDPRGRKDEPENYVKGAVGALLEGEDPPVGQAEPYGCSVKYESS